MFELCNANKCWRQSKPRCFVHFFVVRLQDCIRDNQDMFSFNFNLDANKYLAKHSGVMGAWLLTLRWQLRVIEDAQPDIVCVLVETNDL